MSDVSFNLPPVGGKRKRNGVRITSDDIRDFVNIQYFLPSKQKGIGTIEIVSGDVHGRMNLRSRVPMVCSVLEGKKLQNEYNVDLIQIKRRKGVKKYSTTNRYVFKIYGENNILKRDNNRILTEISEEKSDDLLNIQSENRPQASMLKRTLNLQSCKELGFRKIGSFYLRNGVVETNLIDIPNNNGVYFFAFNEEVTYVGMTQNGIKSRMYQYKNPGKRQETNKRINELIKTLLTVNYGVDIFFLEQSMLKDIQVKIDDLKVHSDEKLIERFLISGINPDWNRG